MAGSFRLWIWMDPPRPYNSFGNGAAMRVSPAAFLNRDNLSAALNASDLVTAVTHNHPEGLKGARATVHAMWLAFQGEPATAIRATIADTYNYDLSRTVDDIRPGYEFNEICQTTVPEAITCALESDSFEDAIRNAISLGGDSDTLAAIAGPIAEALHGIPAHIQTEARDPLHPRGHPGHSPRDVRHEHLDPTAPRIRQRTRAAVAYRPSSSSTTCAALCPGAPVTSPPGCVPAPQRYRPWIGVR